MQNVIVFFDFDGTITKKDSLFTFSRYALGNVDFYKGLLLQAPVLIAYKLRIIPNHVAKEKLISQFFKGWDSVHFQNIANKYSIEQLDKIIRPKVIEKIKWHQERGHSVVVVSASMESWLSVWCKKNDLTLIATKLEFLNNQLTGKFSTKNCYGIEKVNRIKELYNLEDYGVVYAYGDSKGDKEMLGIAHISSWL